MQILKKTIIFLSLLFIFSCSESYKKLSTGSFSAPNEFSQHLLEVYQIKADFEAREMHDWDSAKLYAEKALEASKGNNVYPQKISYWKISKEEEGWQTWDIKKCQDDFLNAMHAIYESLIKQETKLSESNINSKIEEKKNTSNDSPIIVDGDLRQNILKVIYFDFDKSNLSEVNLDGIKRFVDNNKKSIDYFFIL